MEESGGRGRPSADACIRTGHDHGAVVLGLFDCVVPAPFLIVIAGLEDGELEVQVGVERQDDGEWRQYDVGDERGHDCGEGLGQAGDGDECISPISIHYSSKMNSVPVET